MDMTVPLADAALSASLQSALLRTATALTGSPVEAEALVAETLARAEDDARDGGAAPGGQIEMFRRLRQTYHSVERSRGRRPARDAVVTAMAQASKSTPATAE